MLLNKHNLAIASHAAQKSVREVLQAIYVTPTHTVATDSYRLLEVELPEQVTNEQLPHSMQSNDALPFLMRLDQAKQVEKAIPKKPILPILQNAVTSLKGEIATITTSPDLSSEQTTVCTVINGNYPDYKRIVPEGEPVASIKLNAGYLADMAGYIAKHSMGNDAGASQVIIEFHGYNKPIVCRAKTEEQQKIMGILMPLRMAQEENNVSPLYDNALELLTSAKVLLKSLEEEENNGHFKDHTEGWDNAVQGLQNIIDTIEPKEGVKDSDLPY